MSRKPSSQPPLKDPQLFRRQAFLAGSWQDADDGGVIPVTNPADGSTLGTVPNLGAAETRRAVEAAAAAWPAWRERTALERCRVLRRWYDLIMASQEDLAVLMTLEQGKPLAESRGEIAYAASFIEWFAEEGRRVYGDTIPAPVPGRRIIVLKQPIGVVAAVTPWNFPAAMITRKAGPALAAGCTVVLKPASATPFSALALAELGARAGLPAGVLNVVTGGAGPIGRELTGNPAVRKLTFTGSTEIGRKLLEQSAPTVKKVSLELGGNAPFIVFADADLDAAVAGAIASKFRNTGQTCVCTNRFLVHDSVYDAFAQRLVAAVAELKVGPGLEPEVTQGPLIDLAAVRKVEEHLADALAQGGRILLGGARHPRGGCYFQPTVLAEVKAGMAVTREETFGPVAPLMRFQDEAEAVRLANDTPFGLAAYLYTRDLARSWRVAEALEFGIVGINAGLVSTAEAPFGGVKESGLGREGSKYGIEEFLEMKYLAIAID